MCKAKVNDLCEEPEYQESNETDDTFELGLLNEDVGEYIINSL